MPNLIPFQFDEFSCPLHLDSQGTPWWDLLDICRAIGNDTGLQTEMSQERVSLLEIFAIASDIQDYQKACDFLAWISTCIARQHLDTKAFWKLYACVISMLVWKDSRREPQDSEFYWHDVFRRHLDKLIPGARLAVNQQKYGVGIPDFFVKVENDICPVEIKREVFDLVAVMQLRRYIVGFESAYGFAVAHRCSVALDKNMIFISLEGLE